MAQNKNTENNFKIILEISPEQSEQVHAAFELTKVLASPMRLAILGTLALRPENILEVETLGAILRLPTSQLQRDLQQLAEAGFASVEEWRITKAGDEPTIGQVRFNSDSLKNLTGLIAILHRLDIQLRPVAVKPILDERDQTLSRFIKNGRLTSWPTQLKRQLFIVEEVSKAFEQGIRYNESEVDVILKNIYEYDHCTLRRYLVDFKFLQRDKGIYWKNVIQES